MIRDTLVFLTTEAYGTRRKIAVVFIGFALLPALFMMGTVGFDQTLPEDIPVGIAPSEEATTEDDLTLTQGGVALLGTPVQYETETDALRGLDREEVYLVVLVPPNLTDKTTTAEFQIHSHGSVVPLSDATGLLVSFLNFELRSLLPGDVEVTHEQRGMEYTLSEYLIPSFITLFVMSIALLYIPYNILSSRQVIHRVRHQSRLESFITAKFLFYTALMMVMLGAFAVVNQSLNYQIDPLRIEVAVAVGLLFISTAAIGTGILFLTKLNRATLFINFGLLIAVVGAGSLLYPVGFFSSVRMEAARLLPVHYLNIIIRGHFMRGDEFALYADWYRLLVLYTVGCLAFCNGCIRSYEWRS